jgi:phosphoglycolate phosphatase-like HAD superfamily hydrolase
MSVLYPVSNAAVSLRRRRCYEMAGVLSKSGGAFVRLPNVSPARRLVLFDIDGTLITCRGRAGDALARALKVTFGTPGPVETYRYSGKTDPQIVHELMAGAGLSRAEVTPRLPEVFSTYLATLAETLCGVATPLPGVRALLDSLILRDDVALGLLTGNIEPGARIKLREAGLDGYFTVGAFGSDDEIRNHLVPVARERARARWGDDFPGERTIVVGDAEADVLCARAGGARAVAVASGWTERERLAALSPDVLLDSLEPPAALAAILDSAN